MDLDAELAATARTHGLYLAALEAAGFERAEAFALVRDHHATFTWFAMVSQESCERVPPWLAHLPESNVSSGTTARALRILKPRTPEQ